MEYGEYELVKKSNSGEEVLQTFRGITAKDKGFEAFIEYCAEHGEDDGYVGKRYTDIVDGYNDYHAEMLLKWLDKNGYIYEDFMKGAYSLYLRKAKDSDYEDYEF